MNETYNNIQVNIMPLHTPLIPGFGSKGQNFFSSESGHVVYLLKEKVNHAYAMVICFMGGFRG